MSVSKRQRIALGVTGEQAGYLVADRDIAAALDRRVLDFISLGVDRLRADYSDGPVLEATVVASFLQRRLPGVGLLASTTPQREHPYNIARRLGSLDHLSGGRTGALIGLRDYAAPVASSTDGNSDIGAWGGAGLETGLPLSPETAGEFAEVTGKLWHSWPIDSIVADRQRRVLVESERIRRVAHRGGYEVAGPLTVPTTPQVAPVTAVFVASAEELAPLTEYAEVVIISALATPAERAEILNGNANRRWLVYVERDVEDPEEIARLIEAGDEGTVGADGVHLRVTSSDPEGFVRALEAVPFRGLSEEGQTTLRERLGLADPLDPLEGAEPAFPLVAAVV